MKQIFTPIVLLFFVLQGFNSLAQGYFDLHNHLNLFSYLTDRSFTDPVESIYKMGNRTPTPQNRSWGICPDTFGKNFDKGRQANFRGYSQTSLSQVRESNATFFVNSLYSMEKDLYDQFIIRKYVGKAISGVRRQKALYLGDFHYQRKQNHPSMFNDLMGLYLHQQKTSTSDSLHISNKSISYPLTERDLSNDPKAIQVLFSIEGLHCLMDHTPLEFMRSIDKNKRGLDQSMFDAQMGSRFLDTANHFLYTDYMLHQNMRRTFHKGKGKTTLCHEVNFPEYHEHMTERDKLLYRILDIKTDSTLHKAKIQKDSLCPSYFENGRLLYLTFSHFLNNRLIKQADVLDHKSFIVSGLISAIIKDGTFPKLNAFGYMRKTGNKPFSKLGLEIASLCLDTNYGFPIAIDVKHMDASTRKYLYEGVKSIREGKKTIFPDTIFLPKLGKKPGAAPNIILPKVSKKVPLICSHAGVSMIPDLTELITLENMLDSGQINNRRTVLEAGRRRGKDIGKNGMLYPMPINLSDEDILEIANSEGIIGFNLDERILGNSMRRYKKRYRKSAFPMRDLIDMKYSVDSTRYKFFHRLIRQAIPDNYDKVNRSKKRKIEKQLRARYAGVEPMLRNVMHTIWVIKMFKKVHAKNDTNYTKLTLNLKPENLQQFVQSTLNDTSANYLAQKTFEKGKLKPDYKSAKLNLTQSHSSSRDTLYWASQFVCLGTDFDGIIDPLDNYKTINRLGKMRKDFLELLPIYFALDPDRHTADLLVNLKEEYEIKALVQQITDNFFSDNGPRFVKRFLSIAKP